MKHDGVYLPEKLDESSLKDKIFTSAIELFAEYGLNGARMEQIAEKAGTTKRMVVYHLRPKRPSICRCLSMFIRRSAPAKRGLT